MRFTRLTSLQLDRYPSSVFTLEPVCEMREGVSSAERLVRDSHSIVPPPEVRPEQASAQCGRLPGHDDFRRVKGERPDHTRLRAVWLPAGNPPPPSLEGREGPPEVRPRSTVRTCAACAGP